MVDAEKCRYGTDHVSRCSVVTDRDHSLTDHDKREEQH